MYGISTINNGVTPQRSAQTQSPRIQGGTPQQSARRKPTTTEGVPPQQSAHTQSPSTQGGTPKTSVRHMARQPNIIDSFTPDDQIKAIQTSVAYRGNLIKKSNPTIIKGLSLNKFQYVPQANRNCPSSIWEFLSSTHGKAIPA